MSFDVKRYHLAQTHKQTHTHAYMTSKRQTHTQFNQLKYFTLLNFDQSAFDIFVPCTTTHTRAQIDIGSFDFNDDEHTSN